MDDKENPGAGDAHGVSDGVSADASDDNANGNNPQVLPKYFAYYAYNRVKELNNLTGQLFKLDPAFTSWFHDELDLSAKLPTQQTFTLEQTMLSHAVEILPEMTTDEQAGLVSHFMVHHEDPLNLFENGEYLQEVLDVVHLHKNTPRYCSPQVRAAQLSKQYGNAAPSTSNEFKLIRASDVVAAIKPPTWLIKDWIEHDSLITLFGPPKSYKSFLAFDWGCSIATSTPWCDHSVKKTGLVVYIAGEGHNGLGRRMKAWCQHHGISPEELKLVISSRPAEISDAQYVKIIQEETNKAIEEFDALPVLFIIDTLARNFGVGDENNTSDMNTIVQRLDDIRRPYGATILVVHHTGLSNTDRERGSSALSGALDAKFKLTKKPGLQTVTLEPQFMKDAKIPAPMDFDIKLVTLDGLVDDEGGGVSSVVLEHRGGPSQVEKDIFFNEHSVLSAGKRRDWVGEVLYAAWKNDGGSQNSFAVAAGVSGSTVGPVVRYLVDTRMLGANHKLTPKGKAALDILLPMHTLRSVTEHLKEEN